MMPALDPSSPIKASGLCVAWLMPVRYIEERKRMREHGETENWQVLDWALRNSPTLKEQTATSILGP